jgi:molybdopterin-guanine dinucleotide biosynthesis protein A
MGEDKALKTFLGRPLIQRVMERLAPIADELIVTTNRLLFFDHFDTPYWGVSTSRTAHFGPQTGPRFPGRTLHCNRFGIQSNRRRDSM